MSTPFADTLDRYQRAISAARALWRAGLVPECHAYMAAALRALLAAWLPEGADTREELALAALDRAGYPDLDRLRAALESTAALTTAALMAESSPPDVEWIWAEVERLARVTLDRLTPPLVRRRRRVRAAVALATTLVVVLVLMVRLWGRPRATASSVFSPEYPASYAIDGMESTEWLLPDAIPGWLEIRFPSARTVQSVRLLNGHNRHYMDRAVREVRVTAFSDAGPLATTDGQFAELSGDPSVLDLVLRAERVTHLRVDVLASFARGGALADIEVQ